MDDEPPYWFRQFVNESQSRDNELFRKVDRNNDRIDKLEGRVNMLFAGLAAILTIINIIAPLIDTWARMHP